MKAYLLSLSFPCLCGLFFHSSIALASSTETAPVIAAQKQESYEKVLLQFLSLLKESDTEFNVDEISAHCANFQNNYEEAIVVFSQRMRSAARSRSGTESITANELAAAYILGYRDELELLWWKTDNPELRLRILMIFYGSRRDVDVSFFPRFEDYCAKFNPQESSVRFQELLCIISHKAQIEEKLLKKLNPASQAPKP